ncbi:MAG: ATP-binding protein [Acidobacteriota bacterium]|nr:ATP-binding protein [Acidobacteriota bacterium]
MPGGIILINQNDNAASARLLQNTPENLPFTFAPRTDWSVMGDTEHFVQFYEADGFLLNSLSGFISTALKANEGAIVIATKAHRDGLHELLGANGLDLATVSNSGHYVSLDAAETLEKFMVDGSPEPQRFTEVIGGLVGQMSNGRPRIRTFGEMVALLWAEGNYTGAIRLEELWNNLQKEHCFSLFCAYPMSSFVGEKFGNPLGSVCTSHSRVIPAESYLELVDHDERLRAIIQLQQKARSLKSEIVERERIEEELRASLSREQIARAEAETANRMKDEFLATVSHELRTPLNAIIGWSHMLRGGTLDEATSARAIETIDRNAKSQAQLVEDILDVSRVITGKLNLNMAPVDVASIINAAIDSVQLAADSKDIELEVTLDPTARHILGDASRLQQVVWNLLSNAIKFTQSGGRVAIRLKRSGREAQIQVIDSGVGIDADFLPHIFDRFRQADGTTTRRHGGLGLGLSIVRHLVELHGGTAHAFSAGETQGATFTISLPLPPGAPRVRRRQSETDRVWTRTITKSPTQSLPSLTDVRVLLVDDDADTLHVLSVMLADSGAKIEMARSVTGALEVLQWHRPDVIVSDLAMPGEDGYSLIAKVRSLENEDEGHLPAVALTSHVRIEDRARALSAGFNMFVPKPVEPAELINAIANLAETSNRRLWKS